MTHPTDDEIMELAGSWFHTGENQKRDDGYYYRSLGTPSNVRGSDLIEFARALLAEQARTEPVAEFSARVSMLLAHAKRGDSVSHDEVLEIAAMDPDELRRRAVVARDWHRAYQQCLDGLPLKAGMHHTVPAGCWFPRDIRMLVEQLLATQPLKAEQAKDAAEDAELLDWLEAMTDKGYCPAVVFDDDGHWAVLFDGIQSTPGDGPLTSSFIAGTETAWHDSIRAAIRAARAAERKS